MPSPSDPTLPLAATVPVPVRRREHLRFDHRSHMAGVHGDCVRCHVGVGEAQPTTLRPVMAWMTGRSLLVYDALGALTGSRARATAAARAHAPATLHAIQATGEIGCGGVVIRNG